MRWTKIKNIILLLLVVVNLFLLGLVGLRTWRTAQNDRMTQERMLRVLENNGITFQPQVLPKTMTLTAQRLTLTPLGESDAAVLVGEVSAVETQGSRTYYRGERGVLALSVSGDASLEYFSGLSLTEEDVWDALAAVGLHVQETRRQTEGGTLTVEACTLWEDVPLPGEILRLTCVNGVPSSLTFRALTGSAEPQSVAGEPISAATALLRLLDTLNQQGYVCSQIFDLYPGYTLSGAGPFILEPTWFVEIDTSPWRLAINAYTGEVETGN